jgi:hypothetical protein
MAKHTQTKLARVFSKFRETIHENGHRDWFIGETIRRIPMLAPAIRHVKWIPMCKEPTLIAPGQIISFRKEWMRQNPGTTKKDYEVAVRRAGLFNGQVG